MEELVELTTQECAVSSFFIFTERRYPKWLD
nr:MAG TPA: hypothetical protein [Caudoviricetes sp.]